MLARVALMISYVDLFGEKKQMYTSNNSKTLTLCLGFPLSFHKNKPNDVTIIIILGMASSISDEPFQPFVNLLNNLQCRKRQLISVYTILWQMFASLVMTQLTNSTLLSQSLAIWHLKTYCNVCL